MAKTLAIPSASADCASTELRTKQTTAEHIRTYKNAASREAVLLGARYHERVVI